MALESSDVTPVLKWVRESDEATVREAFARARSLKGEGDEIEAMAEQWFLETLIRIHRQGEGAAYTGLNPAGSAPPFYNAADAALDAGDVDELADRIAAAVRDEIHKRFDRARQLRAHLGDSVPAGRAYVKAYIGYMHLVEEIHESVNRVRDAEHFQEGGGHEH